MTYYNDMLKKGLSYQDFVVEKLYDIGLPIISYASKEYQIKFGENKCGFEIKFDDRLEETGNFYIEIAEKSNSNNFNFIPSGIYRADNTWLYLQGNYKKIYIFAKNQLRKLYESNQYKKIEISTSQGFLLSLKVALEKDFIIKIIEIKEN